MKRLFHNTSPGHNKFWEIEVNGRWVTTRFGKINTNGQTQAKMHSSTDTADIYTRRKIREKLDDGYVEIVTGKTLVEVFEPDPPPTLPLPSNYAIPVSPFFGRYVNPLENINASWTLDANLPANAFATVGFGNVWHEVTDQDGDFYFVSKFGILSKLQNGVRLMLGSSGPKNIALGSNVMLRIVDQEEFNILLPPSRFGVKKVIEPVDEPVEHVARHENPLLPQFDDWKRRFR